MERIPFSQHIQYLERGALEADLTERLAELVMNVTQTHKRGSLTLKLDLRYDSGSSSIEILSDVKTKNPEPTRRKSILFPTTMGELVRDDPEQQPLFGGPRDTRPQAQTEDEQENRDNGTE